MSKKVDFYKRSNAYAISIFGNFIQIIQYLVFLPVMEIKMTHTVHIHFHLTSKLSFNLMSTHLISLLIRHVVQKRQNSQLHLVFERSNKKWENFLLPKTLPWEIQFEPCLQVFKKNESGQLEKPSTFILERKKDRGYQQCGILWFIELKTLDSNLCMNSNRAMNQLWIRCWWSVIEHTT